MGQLEIRVEACARRLQSACYEWGIVLSGDQRVGEAHAAQLLGIDPDHLKSMRHEGKGPMAYARGVKGSRVSYLLDDLAAWIEAGRDAW